MAQLYGNDFIKRTLGSTNSGHTPIAAIITCSSFGLLAFLGLADGTYNQVRIPLSRDWSAPADHLTYFVAHSIILLLLRKHNCLHLYQRMRCVPPLQERVS